MQKSRPGKYLYFPTAPHDFVYDPTGEAFELTTYGEAASQAARGATLMFYTLWRKQLKVEVQKTATISKSDLRLLVIDRQDRASESYKDQDLDSFSVIESSVKRCTFEAVRARSTCFGEGLKQSVFEDCVFSCCMFVFGAVGNARLVRCVFDTCRLENLFGTKLELIDCTFPNTTIRKGVIHAKVDGRLQPERAVNEVTGNDFSQARLEDVDFRGGVDLTRQKLPQGEDYLFVADTRSALAIAKELASSIKDENELKHGKSWVNLLAFYCSSGQDAQLFRVTSWGAFEREFRSRLT